MTGLGSGSFLNLRRGFKLEERLREKAMLLEQTALLEFRLTVCRPVELLSKATLLGQMLAQRLI